MRAPLRIEKEASGALLAYRGQRIVGMVVQVKAGPRAGKWIFDLAMGMPINHFAVVRGDRTTRAGAKKAMLREWDWWCEVLGLVGEEVAGQSDQSTGIRVIDTSQPGWPVVWSDQ